MKSKKKRMDTEKEKQVNDAMRIVIYVNKENIKKTYEER